MKSKLFFFIFFVLFFHNPIFGQETIASTGDSIKKYIYNNPEKAIIYSHKFVKLNQAENNTENIILGYSVLAFSHEIMNEIDSTLYYYYKRLSLVNKPIEIIQNKYYIARIFDNNYDYNEALQLYGQIIDLAKAEKNDTIVEDIKFSIELIKTKVGLNRKGLSKEAFKYLKEAYIKQKENDNLILRYNRKSLIEVYLNENNITEALSLINEGINQARDTNNVLFLFYMYDYRSAAYLELKDLNRATSDANEAMDYALQLKNEEFINEINYRLAEIAVVNKKFKEALNNLKTVLKSDIDKSALQASKYFKLTANVYESLDSIRLSNTFYSQYIEEREKATQGYLSAIQSIHDITLKEELSDVQKSYEEELMGEISEKEKLKKTKWLWTVISGILLVLSIAIFSFFRNKSKVNQKRFDDLMIKINAFEQRKAEENKSSRDKKEKIKPKEEVVELSQTIEKSSVEVLSNDQKEDNQKEDDQVEEETETTYIIDDKKVEEILVKLQKLEEKQYYLRQDCTLHNMAKKLKTNTSYLSKIVNTHLDKSFSTYINELRINHAILELKNNKRLRSYSVKGIAGEMGYKNADAFSRYFRHATGISPSVYIKKIEEI
ncbi:helix-turn-helix domain-containing protein [Lacinutrix sp. Hel_I_90]|uniref:helix-turn-helix domain-containing protein n=1 Tax=Lacinutrix sp. Hel_I_90 TaxID=1249999 RepID=UPI0005CACF65|nr:helix-turn-helix domain-containing protein [Lacinutrix sp. Hel_I_90]